MSLYYRITFLVIGLEILLIACFAIYNYQHTRHELLKEFDTSLKNNVQTLATLLEKKTEISETKINFADEIMPQFSKSKKPEIFVFFLPNKIIIEKSKSLQTIPSFVKPISTNILFIDFNFQNNLYRGVILKTKRLNNDIIPTSSFNFYVFYGKSIEGILHEINESKYLLLYSSLIFILLSSILILLSVKRGLLPLYDLLKDTQDISPDNLHKNIVSKNYNPDLEPVVDSFNLLLNKASYALKREKEFSEDITHELRTPITVLKSSIQAEMLPYNNSSKTFIFLESLLDDVNRLNDICEALLETSTTISSNEKKFISMGNWLTEIKSTIQILNSIKTDQQKSIQLISPDFENNSQVQTTISITRQITTNLVKNALIHGGKSIILKVVIDDQSVYLSVKDDGQGIPDNQIEFIFKRFYRVDKDRARESGGAGLGLSVCQSLAMHQEGLITCKNIAPHGIEFIWSIKRKN